MVRSAEIIASVQNTLPKEEWMILEAPLLELRARQVKKTRKTLISQINHIIVETALKNDRPRMLCALPEIHGNEIDDLFSRIVRHYISTGRDEWLGIIYSLTEKLGKKSNQSRIFAMVARDLIAAGVSGKDPALIANGMTTLARISFRKYRSDIMIDIIPMLIVWAETIRDKKLLCESFSLIGEIGDISKRSVLHAELSKALAAIAIQEKDKEAYFYSIRSAAEIHQKIRRQTCIVSIIEQGAGSAFGKEMADISRYMENFAAIPPEAQLELISALATQLLEGPGDRERILSALRSLCQERPSAAGTVIIDLLKKAERSGEPWYLSSAQDLQNHFGGTGSYPLREMIHGAISVATATGSMQVLRDLIPVIEENSSRPGASRTFLQISQIMLSCGDFRSALDLFGKAGRETESTPQYADLLTGLLKAGFLHDCIPHLKESLVQDLSESVVTGAVYRTAIELSRETSFGEIVAHSRSLTDLTLLHPRHDHLLSECIAILGERGFLNAHDPGILIRLAESIGDQGIREQTISAIVIRIAKQGVQLKNRDYLQRAVGLTGEIDGQETRSATLISIIDEASLLAAQQGDLDLLLRMRAWCGSLLEQDLAVYAMANIIEGVIKYAIDRRSPEALGEAYRIAQGMNDPPLKEQMFERIAETFVRIGCLILQGPPSETAGEDFTAARQSFSRGLEIVSHDLTSPRISLKIAGIIDIIISYARSGSSPDFIVPLAMFAAEITNTFERDAMMARIISSLRTEMVPPGSADPYELMAYLLQRSAMAREDPGITDLTCRILRMISDPFTRLSGMAGLADSLARLQDIPRAKKVLDETAAGLEEIPNGYQKVHLLSEIAIVSCRIDTGTAAEFLRDGIRRLEEVEPDRVATARRQIVFAIVRLNTIQPEDRWAEIALEVAGEIADPVEYVSSLIAVCSMIRDDPTKNELLRSITGAVEKIPSPYEKISAFLDITLLAIQGSDDETPVHLLRKAESLTRKINIPYIADRMRDNIAQIYLMLAEKTGDTKYTDMAIAVVRTIGDDEIRENHLMKAGYPETWEVTPQHVKVKALSEKMIADGYHQSQVIALERLVLNVADRGKEAVSFADLAVFFRKGREERTAKRMLQNAIREARIIRPLSRRAYIMCHMALRLHAAGCERDAQEILDKAIDAATNIRQSPLRDEVFDELGLAIRLVQGVER
jgi:hypothetical protein